MQSCDARLSSAHKKRPVLTRSTRPWIANQGGGSCNRDGTTCRRLTVLQTRPSERPAPAFPEQPEPAFRHRSRCNRCSRCNPSTCPSSGHGNGDPSTCPSTCRSTSTSIRSCPSTSNRTCPSNGRGNDPCTTSIRPCRCSCNRCNHCTCADQQRPDARHRPTRCRPPRRRSRFQKQQNDSFQHPPFTYRYRKRETNTLPCRPIVSPPNGTAHRWRTPDAPRFERFHQRRLVDTLYVKFFRLEKIRN